MIDMHNDENGSGVLVDMIYEIVDGIEKVIELKIYNIINNVITGIVSDVSPILKIAFASNILKILEIERNNKNV